jgi:hypothetical protein
MFRTFFAGAALLIAANTASAQITTYVAPPRPLSESPALIAAADSIRRDSLQQTTMANMKAWVDSAAGIPVPSSVGTVDTAALANDPGRPVTTFSDGTVAPATASALPALALLGTLAFVVGAVLLATRPRA